MIYESFYIFVYHNTNAKTAPMRVYPKAVVALAAGVAGVAAAASA